MSYRICPTLVAALAIGAFAAPAHAQSHRLAEPAMSGFGRSLAVDGTDVLVGEPGNSRGPGVVYVYRKAGGVWMEAATVTASSRSPGDEFGSAIAVDGNTMLVGAAEHAEGRGGVFVFQRGDAGEWREVGVLVGSDVQPGDDFGGSVALDGDVALVGAWRQTENAGAVYAFTRGADGSWTERAKLTASDGAEQDRFGSVLALDGETAMIGASRHNEAIGTVYVFGRDATGGWTEKKKLVAGGEEQDHRFGSDIILVGGHALISAYLHDLQTGAGFLFERDEESGEWTEVGRVAAFDGDSRDRFGQSMAFAGGNEVWIGAPGDHDFRGSVYVLRFDPEGGEWLEAIKLAPIEAGRRDGFGSTLALGDNLAAVGLTGADYGMGKVAIYERGADGAWIAAETVWSAGETLDPIVGNDVECREGTASMFDCTQVDLLSFLPVDRMGGGRGVRVNDIWGWTDPVTGKEYALVGRVDGTAFVDISDPSNPVFVGELPKTDTSPGSTWRDIKVFQDHAFIVADGAEEHGMQVFDLTRLREANSPPVTFTEDAHYDQIASAHNIVINEEAGFAFAVGASSGGETCGGGLHMIDIREPTRPIFAGCFADPQTGRASTGYTHDAQCVTYRGPDADYRGREICFGANETALSIADVSDKDSPIAIARAAYPSVGYTHQGWLTEDHKFFFMDDELDELRNEFSGTRTLIWDVADLDDPVLLNEFYGATRATDHNLYIRGNTMYQSNYQAGLRVVDITDVANPVEIGYFDTVPWGTNDPGFGGSWSNYPFFESGVIVVTSGSEGLFVVKKRDEGLVP